MGARAVFPSKRHLLLGLALCAGLHVAAWRTRFVTPARPEIPVVTGGSFQRDGQYPGTPLADATGVRLWGSWSGADGNTGTITIGPFPAPRVVRVALSGYPGQAGNSLVVERVDAPALRQVFDLLPVREQWLIADLELPSDWVGHPIRLVGTDQAAGIGGWFGLSEPVRGGRSDGNNALIQTLAAWATQGWLLGVLYLAALRLLRGTTTLAPPWVPLGAGALVTLAGYLAFWAYFANALLGVVFCWAVLLAALGFLIWRRPADSTPAVFSADTVTVLRLLVAVGAFHLALLHLFPTDRDFHTLAANRYRDGLPGDNVLPHTAAERLFASQPLKNAADEWRASDRPPLQAGWLLLTWPANKLFQLDRRLASGTSAVWFQLLWVTAAFGLLRTFGMERARAAGWTAALATAGFFAQNTVYTWPKLSAGAFALGAFAVYALPSAGTRPRANVAWAAIFAGLAWLSHGGVAFSFLALLPVVAWRATRGEARQWLPAAIILAVLLVPWMAFQKFYDPPGNRLLKWHLGGQEARDDRGTWETIRDSYAKLGGRATWDNKVSNLHGQVFGDWRHLVDTSAATTAERRNHEFFHPGRALTWWPVLALPALALTRRRVLLPGSELALLAGWLGLTTVIWCLLMFGAYTAVIHQGSYALMLGWFALFSILLERAGRGWLAVLVALQGVTLGTTWAVANPVIHGPPVGLPFVLVTAAVLAAFVIAGLREESSEAAPAPTTGAWDRACAALGRWWREPGLNLGVLAALALVLFLRKPHALHTPQLWAEDGSIFLMQNDLHGGAALLMPYMGYLHALPRIIAWLAARLLDPAWWPAWYNGVSFLIWLAALARWFSPRLKVPGKPWLALAMVLVPHTGEVFFTITNLQWLTALVLVQQVIIAPPANRRERWGDALILTLVTLTGPFGAAFLPLFVWRWWRDRRPDHAIALGLVGACAAVQVWFVLRTGPRFEFQDAAFNAWATLVVLARRLAVWPALGPEIALGLPPAAIAGIGGVFLAGMVAWFLRPHPLRPVRAFIVGALVLITAAGVYRARPDTWAADNLYFGDRYFYIPRVLLAWLLIWEFDAVPRALAVVARLFCLAAVMMHLRTYTLRAPTDYHWSERVEPIRQGVRADLPILPENWTLEYRGRPGRER